jgi:hypothetical protein
MGREELRMNRAARRLSPGLAVLVLFSLMSFRSASGAGNPKCFGKAPTRVGTAGDDTIFVYLGIREIRTSIRMPAMFIPSLLVPIFFFYVMVGSLEEFANRAGVANWEAFQLPVAIMFAVTSGSAGVSHR